MRMVDELAILSESEWRIEVGSASDEVACQMAELKRQERCRMQTRSCNAAKCVRGLAR